MVGNEHIQSPFEGRLWPSHMILDHFQWNAEIDPGAFEPNNYTLSPRRPATPFGATERTACS
jgi:hypothetical protein